MGVKFDETTGFYTVSFSKRNPATGQAVSARRKTKLKSRIKKIEQDLIGQVERKIAGQTIPKWGVVIDCYLLECREQGKLQEKTIYNTEKCLNAATREEWGDIFVTKITTAQIRDLVLKKFEDHSISHQKSILKFVRQVFNYALEQGIVNRNPSPKIAFRVGDKIKKVLTEDQARTLLMRAKELDWPWYPHYAMALYTGMRNGELHALSWDKVNLETRQIKVDCA